MSGVTVLVVEDEASIVTLLKFILEQAGFQCVSASSAEEAKEILTQKLPDMLLLDWMLPGHSGLQLMQQLRKTERTRDIPIILLTARGTEADTEEGLNLGADDYITKPFSPRELVARIKSLLRRRAPQKTSENIHIGFLSLFPEERKLIVNDVPVNLGPTEFKLLHFFMSHADRVYSRRQLLDYVWGDHAFLEERTVDVHIRRLRKALAEATTLDHIETVRGAGYRFLSKVET